MGINFNMGIDLQRPLQTEIAPPKIRGFIVGLAQQMIGVGM